MKNKVLIDLGIAVVTNKPTGQFSISEMEETFRAEVAKLVCNEDGKIDMYAWKENSNQVFQIMSEILAEVEPKKMAKVFEMFADIKKVGEGEKARFKIKKGIRNVKRFITRVALAGVYERVRLDRDFVDVDTYAHGGAVYQTMEGFLSGSENITELLGIFMEELENAVYEDLLVALNGLVANLPAANKGAGGAFVKVDFDKVLNTVSAYGTPIIFTTRAFAQTNLLPATGWVSDIAMEEMRNQGYLGTYLGARVVILEQTFTDPSNTVKVLDEKTAYIVPAGSMEKPIKISLEGAIQIRSLDREDWSMEMQIYRKLGIAVVNANHIGIYKIA